MSNFKGTLFGGYKKADVDAKFDELNRKTADLEGVNNRLTLEVQSAVGKVAALEARVAALTAENSSLAAQNKQLTDSNAALSKDVAELEAKRSRDDLLFGDIAKIYKRAYGSGREIVCDSRESALKLLETLNERFDAVMGDTDDMLARYEAVQREVAGMYSALNKDLAAVARSSALMLDKAKGFAGVYGELKDSVAAAKADSERVLAGYDAEASEFLSSDFTAVPGFDDVSAEDKRGAFEVIRSDKSDKVADFAADYAEAPESASATEPAEVNTSAAVAEAAAEADAVAEKPAHGEPAKTARVQRTVVAKVGVKPAAKHAACKSASTEPPADGSGATDAPGEAHSAEAAATAPEAAANAPEVAANAPEVAANAPEAAANAPEAAASAPEAAEAAAAAATENAAEAPSTSKPDEPAVSAVASNRDSRAESAVRKQDEFTQFGRKSRISAEDRNELLRKALLRNGGGN